MKYIETSGKAWFPKTMINNCKKDVNSNGIITLILTGLIFGDILLPAKVTK